jgi:hypothetical protein
MAERFTDLETAALEDICRRIPAEESILIAQLVSANNIVRRNTGVGFFTDFKCADTNPRLESGRLRDGGYAQIAGLEHPMGFILWLEDGRADCLEGYTIDGDTTQIDLETVSFEILPDWP